MARKKRKRGKRQFTLPLAVLGGFGAGLALPMQHAMNGQYEAAINRLAYSYAGVLGATSANPKFDPGGFMTGLVPLIVGVLVHKFIGGKLGVNRALGQAGIPILRI